MLSAKKDSEYISLLIMQSEGETLDFKQNISNSEKIAKTLVAFANTSGGKIVIGVSDRKEIIGIDEHEEVFMIERASEKYCQPPVPIYFELYLHENYNYDTEMTEEKYILVVNVPKSSQKHFLLNKNGDLTSYIRIDDRSIPE
jgi:predicted HTH transcriptional regulator